MANFVYNPYRSEKFFDVDAYTSEWWNYVQKKEFHDDLKETIKSETNSYRDELRRNAELASKDSEALRCEFSDASEQQIEAIRQQSKAITESANIIVGSIDDGFANVTDALETGFSALTNSLDKVSGEIVTLNSSVENLSVMLDWRLYEVIDQQRISNLLLGNIALLMRVPDFQKERQYYIEQGFKHYKNARLDADLYDDALNNLLEAEKREISDYVVLHRIGMIYLYAPKLLNLAKAEDYFRRAAKYAIVESNPQAQQTLNILAGSLNEDLSMQTTILDAAKAVAAKSYFQAGIACYTQGKFADAVELCDKAYSLLPLLLEAKFTQAKSLAVLGNGEKSAEILRQVIEAQPFYSVKTISDVDFAPRNEIYLMLFDLRIEARHQALAELNEVKSLAVPNSQVWSLIPNIESLIEKNTYLDSVKALNELTRLCDWSSPHYEKLTSNSSIKEFVLRENETINKVSEKLIKLKNEKVPTSQVNDFLPRIEELLHKNTFFDAWQAEIELTKDRDWHRYAVAFSNGAPILVEQRNGDRKVMMEISEYCASIEKFLFIEKVDLYKLNVLESRLKEQKEEEEKQKQIKKLEKQKQIEAEKRKQDEQKEKQRQLEVTNLLLQAQNEEKSQNIKWFFKDYSRAISLYEQAAKLGSNVALESLNKLKK